MKRPVLLLLIAGLVASPAFAKDNFSAGNQAKSSAAAKPSAADLSRREELKKKLDEKKKELNGSEWQVDMTSEGKPLGKDTLTFQNNQVTCKTLKDKGYPATNYTVSIPEGSEMAVWETMQTHPKKGLVFIRGEWKEGIMRGVMTEQAEEGKSKDYQFNSVGREVVPPTTEKEEEEAKEEPPVVEQAPETEVETKVETKAEVAPFNPGTTEEAPSKSKQ